MDDDSGAQGDGGAPQAAAADGRPQSSRSLGDIMKEIRRRRDEILNQTEDKEERSDQPSAPNQAPGQVEYLKEDDEQDEEMQALGPAGQEEQQKLADLNIVDDEDEVGSLPDVAMEDGEDEGAPAAESRPADLSHHDVVAGGETKPEQALTQAQVEATRQVAAEGDDAMDVDGEEEPLPTTEQPTDIETAEVEATMRDWVATGRPDDSGESIWRLYSSLTSDLSFALCEQLRLILEPTLATRLHGDFRTGKRLNMRKIIPYIASEFTKDKIWLRRTKPSKREYQVLLSLDDSRSMAESHSVHLAYQTLALVSQALNKLEVGQVSIARFGESVEILHPFGDGGFTDSDGAKVMSAFKFDQHRTDVAALVERSLDTLAAARQASTSSSPDLWQLEIIISDGVCQDHGRLRALLRQALEERVMIVFLIVDSLQHSNAPAADQAVQASAARTSILSMQSVAYKQVNGEMQIEMERYLDTFPFDYYVVLRDVEALPNVLAETLRQWMSRVAESNE
jgi:midasin